MISLVRVAVILLQKSKWVLTTKKLKFLSKNINHLQLDNIIPGFNLRNLMRIGHFIFKTDIKKLDFAADHKDHEMLAREMRPMISKLNKEHLANFKT